MSQHPSSLGTEQLGPLLVRYQQGDRAAAGELIRRAAARLEQMARRMLRGFPVVRSQVETDDVLQSACVRLLSALRQAPPPTTRAFYALASQHIRFHLLDLARRGDRLLVHHLGERSASIVETKSPERSDLACWQALHEAVERLPDEQREVFSLRFHHGWTWPRIAELLHVNERTARRHWLRAGVFLTEHLGDWAPPIASSPD